MKIKWKSNAKQHQQIKYYNHIGDNFYVKNYIGFKNAEDINKFLKFDYNNILKKKFPPYRFAIFPIIILIISGGFFIALIILIASGCEKQIFKSVWIFLQTIFIYLPSLGVLIYSILIYFQVNKNEKLEELKSIKSDEFINNCINGFVSQCQDSTLIFFTVIIIGTSFLLFLITVIINNISENLKKNNK